MRTGRFPAPGGAALLETPRGFTDHEHIQTVGLIHMNGRVQDPVTGRFISPDPSDALNPGVGFNRYAYALNNPLSLVDPDGFAFSDPDAGEVDPGNWGGNDGRDVNNDVPTGLRNVEEKQNANLRAAPGGGLSIFAGRNWGKTHVFTGNISPQELERMGWQILDKLRQYPEFRELEAKAGAFNIVVDMHESTSYLGAYNAINLTVDSLNQGYRTKFNELVDSMYTNGSITGEQLDEYMDWLDQNEYYPFSLERTIFHEAFHGTQPPDTWASYISRSYEKPAIDATNDFMFEHFGEPHRKNHHDVEDLW